MQTVIVSFGKTLHHNESVREWVNGGGRRQMLQTRFCQSTPGQLWLQ